MTPETEIASANLPCRLRRPGSFVWVHSFERWYDAIEWLAAAVGQWEVELEGHPRTFLTYGSGVGAPRPLVREVIEKGLFGAKDRTRVLYTLLPCEGSILHHKKAMPQPLPAFANR